MTTYAFTDEGGGYYEVDVPDGEPMPEWTNTKTACEVRPPPTKTASELAKTQIQAIEQQTGVVRVVREFMLQQVVITAAAMNPPVSEEQLYATNIGYKKAKDINTQIVALREQIT